MIWASWQRFQYDRKCLFSCIYNPQIKVSPTSLFSASFNGNRVKNHPEPWTCPLSLFVFFFALAYERISIKTHSTEFENRSYRTRKSTVCRRICASFSLEILQAWAYTINPFNAQACKISRLNDSQTRICDPFNAQACKMSRLNDAQTHII